MRPVSTPITGREEPIDVTSPPGALAEFYRAFDSRDLGLMQANWLEGEEPVMDNPLGGIRRGWGEIEPTYEKLFGQADKRVRVEFFDYTLHDLGQGFVAIGRERGALEGSGLKLELAIRTSRIFVRAEGRYRQLHHHGSIEDPALLERYRAAFIG